MNNYSGILDSESVKARGAQVAQALTDTQIIRAYNRAHDWLSRNTSSGSWDMPTLAMCYPGIYNAINVLRAAWKVRNLA